MEQSIIDTLQVNGIVCLWKVLPGVIYYRKYCPGVIYYRKYCPGVIRTVHKHELNIMNLLKQWHWASKTDGIYRIYAIYQWHMRHGGQGD